MKKFKELNKEQLFETTMRLNEWLDAQEADGADPQLLVHVIISMAAVLSFNQIAVEARDEQLTDPAQLKEMQKEYVVLFIQALNLYIETMGRVATELLKEEEQS